MSVDELTPQEIAAALAARKELGPEYEHEIAASLADKVQRRIDSEVLARTSAGEPSDPKRSRDLDVVDSVTARWTALASVAGGTIVTVAVTGPQEQGSAFGVVAMTWIGIMVTNVAVNLGRRRRRGRP